MPSTEVATRSHTLSGQPMMAPDEWSVIAHQAGVLAASRYIPKAYHNKPDEIVAAALFGRDLGLSVMQSLNSLHVIDGKVGMSAELMSALIRSRGHSIRFDMQTDDEVAATGIRADNGDTFSFSWTRQHTVNAGLANKQVWKSYWRSMATARVISQIGRTLFPDVLLGGGYSPEELAGIANRDVTVNAAGEVEQVIDLEASEVSAPAAETQRIMEGGTRQATAPARALPATHTVVGAHDARAEQQKLDDAAAASMEREGGTFETPNDLFVAQINADAELDGPAPVHPGLEALAEPTPEQMANRQAMIAAAEAAAAPPEPVAWNDETNQWSSHLPPHGFEYDRWAVKNAPEAPLSDDCTLHLLNTMMACTYAPSGLEEAAHKVNEILKARGPQNNAWAYMQMTKMNAHKRHLDENVVDPTCKSCQSMVAN